MKKSLIKNKYLFWAIIFFFCITLAVGNEIVKSDEVDQFIYPEETNGYAALLEDRSLAQSFKPSSYGSNDRLLSRVKIYLSRSNEQATEPFYFFINRFLQEPWDPFISVLIDPDPGVWPNKNWHMIDFEDIPFIPMYSYKIILYPVADDPDGVYYWCKSDNNPYSHGSLFWTDTPFYDWTNIATDDCIFTSYRDSASAVPDLQIDETEFNFEELKEGQTVTQKFYLSNGGPAPEKCYWEVGNKPDWVDWIEPEYGFISYNDEEECRFRVNTNGLGENYYQGYMYIESAYGDDICISIEFRVPISCSIEISESSILIGEQVQFNGKAYSGVEPYNWTWDFADASSLDYSQNTLHSYDTPGEYNVTLKVTDDNGNMTNSSKKISVEYTKSSFNTSISNFTKTYETIYFNDTSEAYYHIVNWTWDFDDGNISYNQNTNHYFTNNGTYNVALMVTDNNSNTNIYNTTINIDSMLPKINYVNSDKETVGLGSNLIFETNITDNISGINLVKINITYPDNSFSNHIMNNTQGDTYKFESTNNWQIGRYNYTIWTKDNVENSNSSLTQSFNVTYKIGNNNIGSLNRSIENNITGSHFTANEYGLVNNITAYLFGNNITPATYKCMLYRFTGTKLLGTTEEKIINTTGWVTFNFSDPKPILMNNSEYILTCWGNNNTSKMFYDTNYPIAYGRVDNESYGIASDPANWTLYENKIYSIYCEYSPDTTKPEIININCNPDPIGFGLNLTINVNVTDDLSGVEYVKVNISKPGGKTGCYNMSNIGGDNYQYVYTGTWLVGQYNFSIFANDYKNNFNLSSGYSFNVSANATISVCTIKDTYGAVEEYLNITDPPGGSSLDIGYELLYNNSVLHIWNKYDSYYFNTSSGIQLTNHYGEYWTHNVLMLGYLNNDQWNLMYRTDELSGFNKQVDSDNETYVNITIWKDLNYGGYDFRLAIRYYLGVDDNELTVIPYIKNIDDQDINLVLGFGWELRDIQIDMTENDDYIVVGNETYLLNQTLDNTYTNLSNPIYCWNSTTNTTEICGYSDPAFYLMENITENSTKSLYLRWDKDLTYKLCVESCEGQYNAPVTLFIRVGTLDIGQEKLTEMFWYDASQVTYYFDGFDEEGEEWEKDPYYMVDGSTEYFASTTTTNDVELCIGNTYSSSPGGIISKVEIRAHGYTSGTETSIILRPVFDGEDDGDNHVFTLPSERGDWSSWYDITDDTNAPSPWNWDDISNLDCDVVKQPQAPAFCSKIVVRVTYYSLPVISNPYPSDGASNISISPTLSIYVSDADGDSMDITWLSNSSGSWVSFGTNVSVGNGTYYQMFSNASENGQWWYWKVNVSDGVVSTESDVYKFYTGVQSKIVNTGSTNISGYLLIQVQYYNDSISDWVVDNDTINETTSRIINVGDQLALDLIFNGLVSTDDLVNGDGTYRVYAAFRDPDGDVLICDDESLLEVSYEFEVATS